MKSGDKSYSESLNFDQESSQKEVTHLSQPNTTKFS